MFLLRFHPPEPAKPTLNAITPNATDPAPHTASLCASAWPDLGLEFTEAAQREGLRDLQPQPEREMPPNRYSLPRTHHHSPPPPKPAQPPNRPPGKPKPKPTPA